MLAVNFDNDVNPVTAEYVDGRDRPRARRKATTPSVIVLDTPGGLSESMRKIVKNELASKVPVIVYVAPDGARAASAGVWIGEAADVLAMAPQTNIGSSTPITAGGEDIRRISAARCERRGRVAARACDDHGRNAKWGDLAVRKASNLTASEALQMNVIDDIAPTLPALLDKLDGERRSRGASRCTPRVPRSSTSHPGFFTRLLNALIDPNMITLLFLAGLAGIGFEIFHPGSGVAWRARRGLALDRALRLCGPADQLGRARAASSAPRYS